MKQTKKLFKFCTFSNLKKIEDWLQKMEQNGWRISKVYFGLIFYFVECKPNYSKYFFTIVQGKGRSMDTYSYELVRKYNATEIPTIFTVKGLFRIKNAESDLSFMADCRLSFVLKELIIRTSVILCLCISIAVIIFMLRNNSTVWMLILFLIFLTIILLHCFIYLVSCIKEINSNHCGK